MPDAIETTDRLSALFSEASSLPPEDREAYLSRACPDDDALRREVLSLLRTVDRMPPGFLPGGDGRPEASTRGASPPDLSGYRLRGRYTIDGLIGEGGMSVVYDGQQDHPRRRVAVKVIHPEFSSPKVLRRFRDEPEILALLDHPSIVRVFEAGVEDFGAGLGPQPYFVMEYVEGIPLTRFVRERKLPLRERLRLFVTVCDAVQEAHQKGVIHRDLKPGNILVTAEGFPKLFDFGIAKVLSSTAAPIEHTLTGEHQLLGTPQYMSPEQCSAGLGVASLQDAPGGTSLQDALGGAALRAASGTASLREASATTSLQDAPGGAALRAASGTASLREASATTSLQDAPGGAALRAASGTACLREASATTSLQDAPGGTALRAASGTASLREASGDASSRGIPDQRASAGADGPVLSVPTPDSAGQKEFPHPPSLISSPQSPASRIDIRADVYSLGVLLYEMLTDRLPYDVSNMTILSAARTICEAVPTPPSTFDRRLKGDLDAVILKTLEKDRTRRYASATHLADDVRRVLAGEPTLARPATWRTRTARWMRRHPKLTTATVCAMFGILSALSTFIVVRWAARRPSHLMYSPMLKTVELRAANTDTLHTWEGISTCCNRNANESAHPLSIVNIEGRAAVLVGFHQSVPTEGVAGLREASSLDSASPIPIRYARSVCAFDARGPYDEPLWHARIEPNDDFGKDPMGRDFDANGWYPVGLFGPYDIFPQELSPGPEVVVVFNNGAFSQKCYRIYSARLADAPEATPREPLYQVLADGGGSGLIAWDAENGWLVTAGQNSSVYWLHREGCPPTAGYPCVVFAFRPEFNVISTDYLWLESEPPPADIQPPPPRVAWLYTIRNISNRHYSREVAYLLPSAPGDRPEVALRLSIHVGVAQDGLIRDISLPIRRDGTIISGATRLGGDGYNAELQKQRLNSDQSDPYCVNPEEWYLGPLPPLRAESRALEVKNGSQHVWYWTHRQVP
ncbi:MAG: Serine/threonine-protein kinase PknD [Phycisphaerae bacterium]|nr:Serine/threonine-protein kinase PknD [Phycisphaerae bacterium]